MNEWNSSPKFEEEVRQSFGVPEIRSEFVDQVYSDLMHRADAKSRKSRPFFRLRPVWTIALAILSLVIIGTLVIGPQRVYAAVAQLFGYIPGVGIVDQSSPIRMLSEPVSLTRDGITVSVNQAILIAAETRLDFGVSGVPLSAYPQGEAVTGCVEPLYLRLPDGTRMDVSSPVPANVNKATFVLPCIFNTLPGTVPTDWELPLHFVAAPPDTTILPVIDVTPQVNPTSIATVSDNGTHTVDISSNAAVSVEKIIETEDGYILLGSVRANIPEGSWLQITGPAIIHDADDKKVSYSFPNDVQPLDDPSLNQGGFAWVMQIKGAGVTFPLTIRFSGVIISQVDSQALAKTTINVGTNPQPEQVWELNQDVQLAGHTVRLISVTATRDGYFFRIDPGTNLSGVSVQIEGYQAMGGGGGGTWQGAFNTSLVYSELPKGQLILLFTNPLSASPTETWQGQWQPEVVREFSLIPGSSATCLNADTFLTLNPLPAGLDGRMVVTQLNPQLQIVLAGMDGSQQQVIAPGNGRAALTQDGTRLAYSTAEGIVIQDLTGGKSTVVTGIFGRELHWSPGGSQIAYVNSVDINGVFVIDTNGKNQKQLSNLGYESIAGWSPDGSKLYYAIPGSSGDGFLLRSVELSSGNTQDLFVLENSSRKAPMPSVSPDGKWIAYRASDNSSLYIKGLDGSPARLLLDNPATAINGIVWDGESHLLGVSLITPEYPEGEIILITPDSCETYRLPGLSGELDGVFIP
ncbi:MAG: hypothetical protein A2X25_04680 [Chloroflexi bacterium GWB2_49_20]|nr:MAG: hypothetical protein A2X25_04680 [Chloroflexi bacterium GWB2_49_20]OGN80483.1 MAG: hypothetical protein A2X26_11790 [Chloroflexi bacterium GWC2_49_37]OGN83318.1 MAG: hypothetical protein A2X27_11965 [Chloroflexi bacterium GWD2_49_16]